MRDRLFVLDSPPLWSAGKTSTWSETAQQIREYYAAAGSRSVQFLQSYRYLLLLYGALSVAILVSIIKISRRDLTAEGTGIDAHYLACLEHPIAIAALVTLVVFSSAFSKAPGDLLRFVRVVMVIPIVIICFSFVERRMRPFIVGAAVLFVVDVLVMEFLGGTLLARIAVLSLTTCLLAGLTTLLRKQGVWRAFFAERKMVLMRMCCHVATLLLLVAIVANILGNMSLARLLTDGTIISVYWALAVYVFCAVLTALTAALTASDVGRRLRAVRVHTVLVNRKIAAYLTLLNWGLWFLAVLAAFQISTKALDAAREILYYKSKVGAISLSLLDVVLFALVLIVSNIVARLTRFIVDEEILPRTTLDTGVAQAGSRLTYIALLILGLILAFGAAGLELSKLTVLTGAFGVGLAFGLQNLLSNFVSGIIISLERPMKIGDMIEVPDLFGEVTAIGLRSSTVQTFEGASVMVPNSEFITKSFANWSLKEGLRRTDLKVTVAYGTDPSQVLEVLTRVVIGHAQVLPSPLITFDQFGQSSLDFTVRFWSKMGDRLQIRSDLNLLISNEFAKNGIGIALPQRSVHLKPEGDASSVVLAQQDTTKGTLASAGSSLER
jgi:small-conductance mechanosensitive channel